MKSAYDSALHKMLKFIEKIGIAVDFAEVDDHTFLPGLHIEKGKLVVDENKLKYVGDILHEAGHIALMTPEDRAAQSGSLEGHKDPEATEMMVIAWTYAASLEIGINPEIVFHSEGYRGAGQHILQNFNEGRYFGVPMLQWLGMTNVAATPGITEPILFPKMKTWMRS